ncbi:antibiotic biosynthesis monooxygenase [Nocardia sp. BMG51109]|uniref:antibiotic biosynthesis monooxygenase family protein n=1 Tax=Nocardia sp. BMG51109 TaxID=1056816 RepID=UPI000466B924|nr:antibiotic biosynthesis monooxygenase family protein [Nocardia sp. BMG51109]
MLICLNTIRVKGSTGEYEAVYREGSDYMAAQPGHIRHKLLRSTQDSTLYFSIAEWRDPESFEALDNDRVRAIFDRAKDFIEVESHLCVTVYQGISEGVTADEPR